MLAVRSLRLKALQQAKKIPQAHLLPTQPQVILLQAIAHRVTVHQVTVRQVKLKNLNLQLL